MKVSLPRVDGALLRQRRVWVTALVVIVVGTLVAWLALRSGDELPEDAVMRIGDEVVTEAELSERVVTLEALYGVQVPEGEERADFDRDAAKSMALSIVLSDEADERGIEVSEKEARAELDKIVEERLGGDRAQFLTFLGDEGLAEQDVLDEITRTLQTTALYDEVTQDVEDATAQDAKAEYDARKDEMRTPEKRRLRNIVVADRANAQRIAERIAQGDPFVEVARTETLDPSTRKSGGDLGTRESSELEPAYADAAFAVGAGELFGPVQTQYGWNVGQVVSIVPGDPLSFAEVQVTLLEAITGKRQQDAWRDWLGDVLEAADVEYADRYLPDDPSGAPSSYDDAAEPKE